MIRDKILIVDDEENILSLLKMMLDSYEVIATTDPNEAFSLASSRDDICLVISDYYMPTLNGIELRYKLDRFYADKPKPFLFYILTGSVFKSIEAEGRAIGIDAFMYKPIDEDLLISCVTNAFLKASRAS